jgi:hypothetical protein
MAATEGSLADIARKAREETNYRRMYEKASTNLSRRPYADEYAYNFQGTEVHLAFIDSHERRTAGKMTTWEKAQNNVTGRYIHVELWFPFNKQQYGAACSATGPVFDEETKKMTNPGGVFFHTRCFTNPDYTFMRLPVSKKESDELICFCYGERGKPFNNAGMWLSWVPDWLACLPRCCLGVRPNPSYRDAATWFCSELVFSGLKYANILDRIVGMDLNFLNKAARNVKPGDIFKALYDCNAAPITCNQAEGISIRTVTHKINIQGETTLAHFADTSEEESTMY